MTNREKSKKIFQGGQNTSAVLYLSIISIKMLPVVHIHWDCRRADDVTLRDVPHIHSVVLPSVKQSVIILV